MSETENTTTTIQIDHAVYSNLSARKKPGDSFNDVLRRVLFAGETEEQ